MSEMSDLSDFFCVLTACGKAGFDFSDSFDFSDFSDFFCIFEVNSSGESVIHRFHRFTPIKTTLFSICDNLRNLWIKVFSPILASLAVESHFNCLSSAIR